MSEPITQDKLDVSKFNLSMKDNVDFRSNIVVIGLGATGSSFILLLAHFLKHHSRYDITIYDFDYIQDHNMNVSMYGFFYDMGLSVDTSSKAYSSSMLLKKLSGMDRRGDFNNNNIFYKNHKVNTSRLNKDFKNIDYIFVFTDTNQSRHQVAQYHLNNPKTIVFDCRIGSYDQFEVYYSANPKKYIQTIYFEEDGKTPRNIVGNNICLDDRMNFSIAMTSSSLLMNLFIKYLKEDMKQDFKHIMIGNDYIGEVKGYE